jgi:hypothetical protein
MSYNFSLPRLALFAACLAAFFLLGGFSPPEISEDSMMHPRNVTRAWMCCVILFLVGAGSVSLVDHYVGLMEPSNIRLVYVIIGVLLMAGSFVWQRSLKQGAAGASPASANVSSRTSAVGTLEKSCLPFTAAYASISPCAP